jgi:1-acyl-sn-glycerol-3-phosphate acyltransferase
MKKNKKFRQNWFFHVIKFILNIYKRKPLIVNESGLPLDHAAIIVANHSGAAGPMDISLFFPYPFIPWGAHQMKEGYRSRWNYAYHIFYRQKMKYGKFKSFVLATLLSIINKFLYVNITKTMRDSLKHLNDNIPILIFPEDSREGYEDEISHFNDGFVVLADYAYNHRNIDLPIYPVYYSKHDRIIIIGKPLIYSELVKENIKRSDIADLLRIKVNELYASIKSRKVKHKNR